ncbi:hypothetical protein NFI96_001572 [Prochilodus magdalenae]|nr:hypothetical protein NFI96_001572 [Prochilodus magdalenae]
MTLLPSFLDSAKGFGAWKYIQNSAARVLVRTKKSAHITPILLQLHWLPVTERIHYKILLLTFKALHGLAPTYLSALLHPYVASPQLVLLMLMQKLQFRAHNTGPSQPEASANQRGTPHTFVFGDGCVNGIDWEKSRKLHTEKSPDAPVGIRARDLLAVRQQPYPLHHHAFDMCTEVVVTSGSCRGRCTKMMDKYLQHLQFFDARVRPSTNSLESYISACTICLAVVVSAALEFELVRNHILACLTDISSWMTAHHLKLSPSKTELLFIPSTTGPHCDLAISFGKTFDHPN